MASNTEIRLLMIDNYDSFTYNLVQYLGELGADVTVKRNDAIDVAGIRALHPAAVVISPAPCRPAQAVSHSAVRRPGSGDTLPRRARSGRERAMSGLHGAVQALIGGPSLTSAEAE